MNIKKNRKGGKTTKFATYQTYQRVETYSVYGGRELISRARPKSAILIISLVTNKFSGKERSVSYRKFLQVDVTKINLNFIDKY